MGAPGCAPRRALANALTQGKDRCNETGSPDRSVQEISHTIGKRADGSSQIPG